MRAPGAALRCEFPPARRSRLPGEPPAYPEVRIDYREKCLEEGFARIGYPNTGDLCEPGRGRLALAGYDLSSVESVSHSSLTQRQLTSFAQIKAGDYILIPADQGVFQVHFGRVITIDKKVIPGYINPRPNAYYYHYDIARGDCYECAHRVNVQWAKDEDSDFAIFDVPEIGGVWRQAFGQLHKAAERLSMIASKAIYQGEPNVSRRNSRQVIQRERKQRGYPNFECFLILQIHRSIHLPV